MRSGSVRALAAAVTCAAPLAAALADSEGAGAEKTGRYEVKRQNSERGTPGESTNTTLRAERYFGGPVAMFRFDLPLPDEKTSFGGDPFNPRLGDVKVRLRFKSLKSGDLTIPAFVEATFPTADPKTLGKGKYLLSAGIRVIQPAQLPFLDAASHQSSLEAELQQTNSVAGDPQANDVSNTKLELTAYDLWRGRYTTKLKLKPSVDWAQNGKTGAVAELEIGLNFEQAWRTWLMFGHRAWGPNGIANTYTTRVELGLQYTY